MQRFYRGNDYQSINGDNERVNSRAGYEQMNRGFDRDRGYDAGPRPSYPRYPNSDRNMRGFEDQRPMYRDQGPHYAPDNRFGRPYDNDRDDRGRFGHAQGSPYRDYEDRYVSHHPQYPQDGRGYGYHPSYAAPQHMGYANDGYRGSDYERGGYGRPNEGYHNDRQWTADGYEEDRRGRTAHDDQGYGRGSYDQSSRARYENERNGNRGRY